MRSHRHLGNCVRILQISLNMFSPLWTTLPPGQLVNQSRPPSALGWPLLAAELGQGGDGTTCRLRSPLSLVALQSI